MAMATIATAVAVGVATNVLTSKIIGTPDQKAQIGSGTSPSTSPGADQIKISDVEGSSLSENNPFESGSAEQGAMNQQMILDQLQQAGVSPDDLDQYGVAGMAVGGYLQEATRMANGGPLYRSLGGITSLLSNPMTIPDMPPNMSTGMGNPINPSDVDFSQMAPLSPEVEMENMMFNSDDINSYQGSERIDLDMGPSQETAMFSEGVEAPDFSTLSPSVLERVGDFYQSQDPMVQDAMVSSLRKMGGAAATRLFDLGPEERKGSRVRTQTLPGNSNRRRSGLDYSPIQANEGSALQRPMFMPNGGAMHGPGGFKDDLIPVMASNGEYMLSKAAVDHAGGGSHAMGIANLEKFNRAGNKRYGQ